MLSLYHQMMISHQILQIHLFNPWIVHFLNKNKPIKKQKNLQALHKFEFVKDAHLPLLPKSKSKLVKDTNLPLAQKMTVEMVKMTNPILTTKEEEDIVQVLSNDHDEVDQDEY